ncbi:MAG: DUF499 domain-containing protein [Gemmatimonadetes bacterium]|nr:DUF499 domain-containing protein [Gemmatimonadota bacterium]
MEPWYRIVTLRQEVREGRSFSPDEFAIALEQVVAGTAPRDYCDSAQFFSRTCFTRALTEHAGIVLRRLAGKTENTAPVLTLITQFGGGKTHTLTSLYHLAKTGSDAIHLPGVTDLLNTAGLPSAPSARIGVFVGNAWDPAEGRETPWIDLARQLGGDQGVAALGDTAQTTPPGTEALAKMFAAADSPVLLLFDEVLNFVNRHRNMAGSFHAFIQNLSVAVTGTTRAAAVISLPRSQVEMTDWDEQWQERIRKVVGRVARDLITNDEAEISEVVRRRLFEDLGKERVRKRVAKTYADWCFERTARLPAEWLAVDTARTEAKAREFLKQRFEACYPFHPATLSVFQRKWRALAQFQQTRGALAMLAQWISWAAREHFRKARTEPLITLGSAPLNVPEFRAAVLGQLGEPRLDAAIEADLAGETSHARALDADAQGALRDIHQRVGATILFESSGGQVDKVAHLPELRFALGEPDVETTTIDNVASALEASGFFIRKIGTDGYRIHHQATLKKVVSDRRASLDEEGEIRPAMRRLVEAEFRRGATLPVVAFPLDSASVQDSPRLSLIIVDPEAEWKDGDQAIEQIARWTKERGRSPRLYPASLVWCAKKPGRELRDKVELWLAWQRVAREVTEGVLGTEFDRTDRAEVESKVRDAETAAKDEVWAGYRFVALSDGREELGLKMIDLGAGHSSSTETLCGRVVGALKSEALLNENVGAGYIERNWPPAFRDTGAWPLSSLRQSFLDGSLTRLSDPDTILRRQTAEFVSKGDFGLASGDNADGTYGRIWHAEPIGLEEVTFESSVFLLTKARAEELVAEPEPSTVPPSDPPPPEPPQPVADPSPDDPLATSRSVVQLSGTIPHEVWNRLGTRVLPKLRSGDDLNIRIDFSVNIDAKSVGNMEAELRQVLDDLGLKDRVQVKRS